MLSYTSNRNVASGLLAVRPLTEAQVAEYRFWRPCGRRACAFGCGGVCEGEVAAAKRLFRDVSDVLEKEEGEEEEDGGEGVDAVGVGPGMGREEEKEEVERMEKEREREKRWEVFRGFGIGQRERDGVADV
jgi:hypothetical protein